MIGTGELLVILCIVLLLFGGKKLPEIAKSLGQGIREFKRAASGDENSCSGCDKASITQDEEKKQ